MVTFLGPRLSGIILIMSVITSVCCSNQKEQPPTTGHSFSDTIPLGVITYVGNEGVLVSRGDMKVLIDALHYPYLPDYQSTPDSLLDLILHQQPPFDGVDVMLVTHPHGDHFHKDLVYRYMQENENVVLVTSEEVKDSLKGIGNLSSIGDRIDYIPYLPFSMDSVTVGDIQIKRLHMPHSGFNESPVQIQNMAYLLNLKGIRVLHLGDTGFEEETYSEYDFERLDIDIGLIPDWLLAYRQGTNIIDSYLPCKHKVAIHVSPDRIQEIEDRIGSWYDDVVIFSKPGQEVIY